MTIEIAMIMALLARFNHMPARHCIESRQQQIAQHLVNAREIGVPPSLMLSVSFHESWVGCHPGEGGNWGAPVDRSHRHTAGTPEHAARALATSYRVCGTWSGAISRFRSGLCDPRPQYRRYVASVQRLADYIQNAVESR